MRVYTYPPRTGRFPVTVTDAAGAPVAGATVMVEGQHIGTTTGTNGTFSLAAPANGKLVVSFIGYDTETVAIAGHTHVSVTLEENAQAIDNVVITAFGEIKKKDFTGSIASVSAGEISKTTVASASRMLEGAVTGVQSYSSTGQPGDDASIIHPRYRFDQRNPDRTDRRRRRALFVGAFDDQPARHRVDRRVEGRRCQRALRFACRKRRGFRHYEEGCAQPEGQHHVRGQVGLERAWVSASTRPCRTPATTTSGHTAGCTTTLTANGYPGAMPMLQLVPMRRTPTSCHVLGNYMAYKTSRGRRR